MQTAKCFGHVSEQIALGIFCLFLRLEKLFYWLKTLLHFVRSIIVQHVAVIYLHLGFYQELHVNKYVSKLPTVHGNKKVNDVGIINLIDCFTFCVWRQDWVENW